MLKEFRCPNCNKLLGKIEGTAELKCERCGRVVTGVVSALGIFIVEDEHLGRGEAILRSEASAVRLVNFKT